MPNEHIVKSFDDDLKRLDNVIAEMGGLAELQLANAIDAMVRRNEDLAEQVIASDKRIDAPEVEVGGLAVAMLALRQPMADDLRVVITALRTAAIIERIGDYAKNISKRTVALSQTPPMGPSKMVARMGRQVQHMIQDVLDAYIKRDASKAEDVRESDAEVDALHTSLFREILTYMMEDPRVITSCTHLLFVTKNIKRIGDHATNIAENVYFLVNGYMPVEKRHKDDDSSFLAVKNAEDAEPTTEDV